MIIPIIILFTVDPFRLCMCTFPRNYNEHVNRLFRTDDQANTRLWNIAYNIMFRIETIIVHAIERLRNIGYFK